MHWNTVYVQNTWTGRKKCRYGAVLISYTAEKSDSLAVKILYVQEGKGDKCCRQNKNLEIVSCSLSMKKRKKYIVSPVKWYLEAKLIF